LLLLIILGAKLSLNHLSKFWGPPHSKSINHIYTFSNLKPATEYTFQITAWYSDVSDWTLISNIQESASDVRKFKTLKAID